MNVGHTVLLRLFHVVMKRKPSRFSLFMRQTLYTQAYRKMLNICNFADKELALGYNYSALAMKDSEGIKTTGDDACWKLDYSFNKTSNKDVIARCKPDVNLMLMTIDTHRVMLTQVTR